MNTDNFENNNLEKSRITLNLKHSLADFRESEEMREVLEKSKLVAVPDFARAEPDFAALEHLAGKYKHYHNFLIVGNGGAINSFRGFYTALAEKSGKKMVILNTVEPGFLNEIKAEYSPADSLLVIVSKSGVNPTGLEIMFFFWEYSKIVVCTENTGALYEIVRKEKIDPVFYPSPKEFPGLEDRHTGFTASGLLPASLVGIDVEELYRGAKEMYRQCDPSAPFEKNMALQAAVTLYYLEQQGYFEIFCPVYSTKLFGFLPSIIQLMHETVCKDGKGQTIFGDLAPESQHHTNQRFFGGKKNVVGLFITAGPEEQESVGEVQARNDALVNIPASIVMVPIRSGTIKDFEGIPYHQLLNFEFQGTFQDAAEKGLPLIHLHVGEITPFSIGQFLAFFQYLSYYSACLRGVNPSGQPQVERSKEISFELVKGYNRGREENQKAIFQGEQL